MYRKEVIDMKNAISQKCFQKPYLFLFFNTVIYTLIAFAICTIAAFVAAGISDRWTLAQCMRSALLATAWAGVIFGWYGGILYWMRKN